MSLFQSYDFGYNKTPEQRREDMAEARRRANQNLVAIREGKYRKEKRQKERDRRTELEKALAWEIQLGHDVLERRELTKHLNRLLGKAKLTDEEHGAAEEYQHLIDKYDTALEGYTYAEVTRFVRLWNKSQKQRYRL